eukprot:UN27682
MKRPASGDEPDRKRQKTGDIKRLFKDSSFCENLVCDLINLAEIIERGQKETIEGNELLKSSEKVMKQLHVLKSRVETALPDNHPKKPCDKDLMIESLQNLVTKCQHWQEKICIQGSNLYDSGSTLQQASVHCLRVWQKVWNRLQAETYKSFHITDEIFHISLNYYKDDLEISELYSRLKTAATENPIITNWK